MKYIIIPLLIGLLVGSLLPPITIVPAKTFENNLGTLTVIVKDSNGNIINQYKQPIHSPTIQFADIMHLIFGSYPNPLVIWSKNTSGYINTIGLQNSYLSSFLDIGTADDRCFIAFGNGTSPLYRVDKYKLDNMVAKIPASAPSIGVSSSNITITISATYSPVNNTTITEVGIILQGDKYDLADNNYADFLVVYDVLATPVQVPAGGSITVTYNFVINI